MTKKGKEELFKALIITLVLAASVTVASYKVYGSRDDYSIPIPAILTQPLSKRVTIWRDSTGAYRYELEQYQMGLFGYKSVEEALEEAQDRKNRIETELTKTYSKVGEYLLK